MQRLAKAVELAALAALIAWAFAGYLRADNIIALLSGLSFCG